MNKYKVLHLNVVTALCKWGLSQILWLWIFFIIFLHGSSRFYNMTCPSVGRSVGRLVTQTFEMSKTANFDAFLHLVHPSCLTGIITIHWIIHSFIHSFIHTFIHSSKTFIHKILIKQGEFIDLELILFHVYAQCYTLPGQYYQNNQWSIKSCWRLARWITYKHRSTY